MKKKVLAFLLAVTMMAGNTSQLAFAEQETGVAEVLQAEETASIAVADGSLTCGRTYTLPNEIINYSGTSTLIRQYASEKAGGVYFLRDEQLQFLNVSTGKVSLVYQFPVKRGYVYHTNGILYWAANGQVIKYDLDNQKVVNTLKLGELSSTYGIGVDSQGRIYCSVRGEDWNYYLQLYSADGTYLDSVETEGAIYEFSGFGTDGGFYFVGYHNWLYWGYDHSMRTLFCGKVQNGKFAKVDGDSYLRIISNLCQIRYYDYQDNATILGGKYLTDKLGDVYDISGGVGNIKSLLYVPHEYDEKLIEDDCDNTAIGTRMLYQNSTGTLIAYASGKYIYEYNMSSKEKINLYKTSHYVFNLLQYGDSIIAIEKENGTYYIEWFDKDSFVAVETVTVNLNETATYRSHTKEEVQNQWEKGYIKSDIKVYDRNYSTAPYQSAAFSNDMKDGLLRFSNYMRWLGGLTPFESADAATWEKEGKGAVLLTALNQMTHEPSKPDNMDDTYYEEAYNACSTSNLYSVGINSPESAMNLITGWTNDTANVSNLALGHRFTFLQRAGKQIAYGSANYTLQHVEAYGNQVNKTGTIQGVDNNDYAYSWPGAGYFPTTSIDTSALWSINLNSDLIDLSNKSMQVKIKDLNTGTVYDVTDSIGSSAYYGVNTYFGYFYGECFYFDSPEEDSYDGKSYQVTISNLELTNGQPAQIVYTVNFFTPEHSWGSWKKSDTSENEEQRVCTLCGEKETREATNEWSQDQGKWSYQDGNWYYFSTDDVMQTGWQKIDGTWYYMDGSGAMVTGWQEIGGSWYYFYGSGAMAERAWVDGYYLGRNGAWVPNTVYEGWMQSGNGWWYQYADGNYAANEWYKIDGTWYYFDAAGWMCTGWTFDGSNWYYMNSSGMMQTGWLQDGNAWYYLNPSGAMATGWVQDGDEWYLMDASGVMMTGWVQQGDTWYYLRESGVMAHDTVIDGYLLGGNGAWIPLNYGVWFNRF